MHGEGAAEGEESKDEVPEEFEHSADDGAAETPFDSDHDDTYPSEDLPEGCQTEDYDAFQSVPTLPEDALQQSPRGAATVWREQARYSCAGSIPAFDPGAMAQRTSASASATHEAPSVYFHEGQKLEAVDRSAPRLKRIGVATVRAVSDDSEKILVHFDGRVPRLDYWAPVESDDIAVCGTCDAIGYPLHPPPGEEWYGWDAYLERCGAAAAPGAAFKCDKEFFYRVFEKWTRVELRPRPKEERHPAPPEDYSKQKPPMEYEAVVKGERRDRYAKDDRVRIRLDVDLENVSSRSKPTRLRRGEVGTVTDVSPSTGTCKVQFRPGWTVPIDACFLEVVEPQHEGIPHCSYCKVELEPPNEKTTESSSCSRCERAIPAGDIDSAIARGGRTGCPPAHVRWGCPICGYALCGYCHHSDLVGETLNVGDKVRIHSDKHWQMRAHKDVGFTGSMEDMLGCTATVASITEDGATLEDDEVEQTIFWQLPALCIMSDEQMHYLELCNCMCNAALVCVACVDDCLLADKQQEYEVNARKWVPILHALRGLQSTAHFSLTPANPDGIFASTVLSRSQVSSSPGSPVSGTLGTFGTLKKSAEDQEEEEEGKGVQKRQGDVSLDAKPDHASPLAGFAINAKEEAMREYWASTEQGTSPLGVPGDVEDPEVTKDMLVEIVPDFGEKDSHADEDEEGEEAEEEEEEGEEAEDDSAAEEDEDSSNKQDSEGCGAEQQEQQEEEQQEQQEGREECTDAGDAEAAPAIDGPGQGEEQASAVPSGGSKPADTPEDLGQAMPGGDADEKGRKDQAAALKRNMLWDRCPWPDIPLGFTTKIVSFSAVDSVAQVQLPEGREHSLPVWALRGVRELQILRWAQNFPGSWASRAKDMSFVQEDICCTEEMKHESRRANGKRVCCIQFSLSHVAGRMQDQLKKFAESSDPVPTWVEGMHACISNCDPPKCRKCSGRMQSDICPVPSNSRNVHLRVCSRCGCGVFGGAHIWQCTDPECEACDCCTPSGAVSLQNGLAAAHIFTAELLQPNCAGPRPHQIYTVLNRTMREHWAEQLCAGTDAAERLRVFAPLIYHLHYFTQKVGSAQCYGHSIVYRGIRAIVAQGYAAGNDFVWGCFSSTTETSNVAETFSTGVGTLFVLREHSAAPVQAVSLYHKEAERVLGPTRFRILARMPETLLSVAETRSDIVIAEEEGAGALGEGEHMRESGERVKLLLKAHRCAAFILEKFAGRFVEPRLRREADVYDPQVARLFEHFDQQGGKERVTLLRGNGGTGKTSILLALLERFMRNHKDDDSDSAQCDQSTTALFVHCPWAEGLLKAEASDAGGPRAPDSDEPLLGGPLVQAVCAALNIKSGADLQTLKKQSLVLLFDSLDECPISAKAEQGPGALLRETPLLQRGGFQPDDWPNARFIICCRQEYLKEHNIRPRMLDRGRVAVCDVVPFNPVEKRQYIIKIAAQEVKGLHKRLSKPNADVQKALDAMRCVPCEEVLAEDIRQSTKKSKTMRAQVEAAHAFDKDCVRTVAQREEGVLDFRLTRARFQIKHAIDNLLDSLPADLVKIPFVLFLASTASRQLANRKKDLARAPKYVVYSAWVELEITERIERCPELDEYVPPCHDRLDRLMDACSTLAVGMFAQRRWQATVGQCVDILCGDNKSDAAREAARAVLKVLPLRMETSRRDDCRVTWRHRTVQEFAIGRTLLLPSRAPAAMFEAVLSGPLHSSPEARRFFEEGTQVLTLEQNRRLSSTLSMAQAMPSAKGLALSVALPHVPAPPSGPRADGTWERPRGRSVPHIPKTAVRSRRRATTPRPQVRQRAGPPPFAFRKRYQGATPKPKLPPGAGLFCLHTASTANKSKHPDILRMIHAGNSEEYVGSVTTARAEGGSPRRGGGRGCSPRGGQGRSAAPGPHRVPAPPSVPRSSASKE